MTGIKNITLSANANDRGFYAFSIVSFDGHFALSTTSNEEFAHLDSITCRAIHQLKRLSGTSVEGIVDIIKLKKPRSNVVKDRGIFSLSVNVYGPLSIADEVGDMLSKESMFLQIPYLLPLDYKYFNPQLFRPGGKIEDLSHLVGLDSNELKAKSTSEAIERVLDSLESLEENHDQLSLLFGERSQPSSIMTQLKR